MTLALTTLAVCMLLFFIPFNSPERTPLLLYAPLPLVAWATIRFGVCRRLRRLPDRRRDFHARHGQWLRAADAAPIRSRTPCRWWRYHVVMSIIFLTAAALLDEWRHAGRALTLSTARFRSIFENNIIPIAIWRDDLRISEANEAFLRLTGFSGDDIQSGKLRFEDLATLNSKPASSDAEPDLESSDLLERFDNAELELALSDGRRVPVILGHCRFPADEGGVIYALDLSSFRRAEARRQRVESLHAAVLASLHDQVAVVDSRGTVIEINDSWRHAVDCRPALPLRSRAGWRELSAMLRARRRTRRPDRHRTPRRPARRAQRHGRSPHHRMPRDQRRRRRLGGGSASSACAAPKAAR